MNRPTSLYLDIVRLGAALVVLLSHVSFPAIGGGQLGLFHRTGTQAVDVFFVLSGFVIAYVTSTREQDVWSYGVSRAARIYSVALPALIVTALVDAIGRAIDPALYQEHYQSLTAGLVIRSICFIGEQWNAHRFPGSDGPYWSLGFEIWYYIAFAAFVFSPKRWRWIAAALVLAFVGPKVALMMPIWLMGVACYRICTTRRISPRLGWALLILPPILLAVYETVPKALSQPFAPVMLDPHRLFITAQDYFLGALFSIHLIGFHAVSEAHPAWLERHARAIRWLAGGTFSLYLMHLPLLYLLTAASPFVKSSFANLAYLLIVTPLLCYGFAQVSERRKKAWHNGMETLVDHARCRKNA